MKTKNVEDKAITKSSRYLTLLRCTGIGLLCGAIFGIPLTFLGTWLGFIEQPHDLQDCLELILYGILVEGIPGAVIGFVIGCFP